METIRQNLTESAQLVGELIAVTTDQDDLKKLLRLERLIFALWREVIRQELDKTSADYLRAIEDLKQAQKSAKEAVEDLTKIADAISDIVMAAKAVDKLVKLGIDMFL